ncbi:MAG: alkaline phosphatase family protein [Deltaproteobacteria bacterium]|nr:alkaline phosphatase family protein [Deltaproteobacteria bacterium]
MTARALVVGLDGFDLKLVHQFGPEHLPNLHALMARGVFAALESVQPPATLPNWTTFLTGVDPARHGRPGPHGKCRRCSNSSMNSDFDARV